MSDVNLVFSMEGGRVSKNPHTAQEDSDRCGVSAATDTSISSALSERRVLTVHSQVFMVIVKR